ncbi:aldose epimerase [Lysobacter soli]|uniref:aldose 1-epimerase n=1 Tax=Lysobacter soli TaxID=453783 RepID=UPI0012ED23DC|nr:aldose epimerase [Lysobacter soli]QGW63939.1 aldose epimerase [Lysobacter soli]
MAGDAATARLEPGPLLTLSQGAMSVDVAPQAGGRIAQIRVDGVEQLAGFSDDNDATIGWGSYPMVPWAGRVRRGEFAFEGASHRLPANLGVHAIHGVGFALPWQVDSQSTHHVGLSLALPEDERWPFGGIARQRIELETRGLRMTLSATAGERAMPAELGWHPWFLKPDRIEFAPTAWYPRDEDGMATRPLAPPPPGPWDDCFMNDAPVVLHRGAQRVTLTSDCAHWVVFDMPERTTCVEPQSGPPDAFNLEPRALAPGQTLERWFRLSFE